MLKASCSTLEKACKMARYVVKQFGTDNQSLKTREFLGLVLLIPMPQQINKIKPYDETDEKEFKYLMYTIPKIIEEFKKDINTRKASFAHLYGKTTKTRCFSLNHWFIRNGKLFINVYSRSCDVVKRFPFNLYTYAEMWNKISSELNIKCGEMLVFLANAHYYLEEQK